MSVLVTGGAGYIGSHVAHALVDAGERVVVLDNLSTGFEDLVPRAARLVVGDIADDALLKNLLAAEKIGDILHFAGAIVVSESMTDPLAYYLNNTVRSHALIGAAVAAGIERFVFSSTAAVYGNPSTNPVVETAVLDPISPYGKSKLMTETMLWDSSAAHGLQSVALRYFNVAGADPKGRTGQRSKRATHLIKVACEAAVGKRADIDVFGSDYPTPDGTCVRDYIHVHDLASAHLAALDYLRRGGRSAAFNCGYSRGFSVLQVLDSLSRTMGRKLPVRFAPRRAGDPAELVAGCEKLRSELNWTPDRDDLDTIVRDAIEWERKLLGTDDGKLLA